MVNKDCFPLYDAKYFSPVPYHPGSVHSVLRVLCRVTLCLMDCLVMTISSNEWSGFGQKYWVKLCSSRITVRFPMSHCSMSWIRTGQFNYLTYFTTTFLQPALVNAMLQYNLSRQTLIPCKRNQRETSMQRFSFI